MWELIKTLILGDYVILRRVEYDNLVIQLDRQRRQIELGQRELMRLHGELQRAATTEGDSND